jgi:hypothetical protein
MTRTSRVAATVAVGLLLATACGANSGVGAELTSPPRPPRAEAPARPGPGGPDLSLPDLGEVDECLEVASVYAGLAFSAIGGPEAAQQARERLEELKARLPEDLHDDLDVVADTFDRIAEEGIFGGADALEDPAFEEANRAIEAYLREACGGG